MNCYNHTDTPVEIVEEDFAESVLLNIRFQFVALVIYYV